MVWPFCPHPTCSHIRTGAGLPRDAPAVGRCWGLRRTRQRCRSCSRARYVEKQELPLPGAAAGPSSDPITFPHPRPAAQPCPQPGQRTRLSRACPRTRPAASCLGAAPSPPPRAGRSPAAALPQLSPTRGTWHTPYVHGTVDFWDSTTPSSDSSSWRQRMTGKSHLKVV